MSFAENYWAEIFSGKSRYAVLFKMVWKKERYYYQMEGAYAHENEILLLDGQQFVVADYQEECRDCGIKIYYDGCK